MRINLKTDEESLAINVDGSSSASRNINEIVTQDELNVIKLQAVGGRGGGGGNGGNGGNGGTGTRGTNF